MKLGLLFLFLNMNLYLNSVTTKPTLSYVESNCIKSNSINKNLQDEDILVNDNCFKSFYENCSKISEDYKTLNNATCILCKTLVSTIDYGIIKGNQTIQEITQVIKDICCMIHGPRGNECVFVLNNIQLIIKYISNGLTNIEICRKLHLCT